MNKENNIVGENVEEERKLLTRKENDMEREMNFSEEKKVQISILLFLCSLNKRITKFNFVLIKGTRDPKNNNIKNIIKSSSN